MCLFRGPKLEVECRLYIFAIVFIALGLPGSERDLAAFFRVRRKRDRGESTEPDERRLLALRFDVMIQSPSSSSLPMIESIVLVAIFLEKVCWLGIL